MIWTLERIKELVSSKVEENLHLDYKRLQSLTDTKEISKDISAFANSDGGVVIYGVIEKNNTPEQIDDSLEQFNKSKEWLENVVTSNINPIIDGVIITPINNPDSGNQLFVIEVPMSARAPHMANDRRYYKRFNFKSQPMEHYEIEDIRNRATTPDLDLNIFQFKNDFENDSDKFVCEFNFQVMNTANSIVNHYNINVYCPKIWQINLDGFNFIGDVELNIGKGIHSSRCYSKNYSVPNNMPLWKNKPFTLLDKNTHIEMPLHSQADLLIVDLSYPYALTKRFMFGFVYNPNAPKGNIAIKRKVEILNE